MEDDSTPTSVNSTANGASLTAEAATTSSANNESSDNTGDATTTTGNSNANTTANGGEAEQRGQRGEACLFTMASDGDWMEIGVGSPTVDTTDAQSGRFMVHNNSGELLLDTCLSPDDIYTVQRGSVLVWQDPDIGKDMALSFNHPKNCTLLVAKIADWQDVHRANFSLNGGGGSGSSPFGDAANMSNGGSEGEMSSPWAVARENLPALLLAANENRSRFCQYVATYQQTQEQSRKNRPQHNNDGGGGDDDEGAPTRPPTFYDDLLTLFRRLSTQSPPDEVGMAHVAILTLSMLHPPFSHDQTVLAPMVSEELIDETIDLVRFALRRTQSHTVNQMLVSREERWQSYQHDESMAPNFSQRGRYIFALMYLRDMLPLTLEDGDAVAGGLLSAFILKLKQGLASEVLDSDPNYLLSRMDAVRSEVAAASKNYCDDAGGADASSGVSRVGTSSAEAALAHTPSTALCGAKTEDPDRLHEEVAAHNNNNGGPLSVAEKAMYHALNMLHEICTMIRGSLGAAEPKEVILMMMADQEVVSFLSFVIHHSLRRYFDEKHSGGGGNNNQQQNNNLGGGAGGGSTAATAAAAGGMSPQVGHHPRGSTVSAARPSGLATSSRRTQQPAMSHDWLSEILKCVDIMSHFALFSPVLAREQLLREEALRLAPQVRQPSSNNNNKTEGSQAGLTGAEGDDRPPAGASGSTEVPNSPRSTIVVEASIKVDDDEGEEDDMPPPAAATEPTSPVAVGGGDRSGMKTERGDEKDEVPPGAPVVENCTKKSEEEGGKELNELEALAASASATAADDIPSPQAALPGGDSQDRSQVPETPLKEGSTKSQRSTKRKFISSVHDGKPLATQLLALFGQVDDTVLLQGLHDCVLSCSFGIAPNQTMNMIALRGAIELESTLTLLLGFWTMGRLPTKVVEDVCGGGDPLAPCFVKRATGSDGTVKNPWTIIDGTPALEYLTEAATPGGNAFRHNYNPAGATTATAAAAAVSTTALLLGSNPRASPASVRRGGAQSGRISSALAEECGTYHALRMLTLLLNSSVTHSRLGLGMVPNASSEHRKCFISDAISASPVVSSVSSFIQHSLAGGSTASAKLVAQCSSFLAACATSGSQQLEQVIMEENLLEPIIQKMSGPRSSGLRRDNILGSSISGAIVAIVSHAEKKIHQLTTSRVKHKRELQRGSLDFKIKQATDLKAKVAAATRMVCHLHEQHQNVIRSAQLGTLLQRIEGIVVRAAVIANEPLPSASTTGTPTPVSTTATAGGGGGPSSPRTPNMLGGGSGSGDQTLEELFDEQSAKFDAMDSTPSGGGLVRQSSFHSASQLGKRDRSQSQETDIPLDGIDIVSSNASVAPSVPGGDDGASPVQQAALDATEASPSTPSDGAGSESTPPPPLPTMERKKGAEGDDDSDDDGDGEPFMKKRRLEK